MSQWFDASITVGASSVQLLPAGSAYSTVLIHNCHATNSIAVNLVGGTAVLNTAGSITIGALGVLILDTTVTNKQINIIASAGSTPVTCHYSLGLQP